MFKITIDRAAKEGILRFTGGANLVNATCWWDPLRKIPAGTYTGCSATTMRSKLNSQGKPREGVYIPDVSGFSEIFIHMGNDASWSDGCIVIREPEMLKIYNAVRSKNSRNVTVIVRG